MAHMQLLSATQTLTETGFSSTYGAAAQLLEWSLLSWVPAGVNSFGLALATYQPAGTGGRDIAAVSCSALRRAGMSWREARYLGRLQRFLLRIACHAVCTEAGFPQQHAGHVAGGHAVTVCAHRLQCLRRQPADKTAVARGRSRAARCAHPLGEGFPFTQHEGRQVTLGGCRGRQGMGGGGRVVFMFLSVLCNLPPAPPPVA